MTKAFHTLCSSVCIWILCIAVMHGQSNVCNDQINVTVNHNCAIDLTVDAFLEDDDALEDDILAGFYTYEIYNHTGTIVLGDNNGPTFGGDDMSAYVNSLLFFKVYFQGVQACWGTVLLEDKNEPTIDCSTCPPRYGSTAAEYDPECIRNCFEQDILQLGYDIRLRDAIVQEDYEDFIEDFVTDNCNNWELELTSYYDLWNDFGPCEGARLTRTWNISYQNYDNTIGTVSCTREYFFRPISLNEVKEYPRDPITDVALVEPIRNCLILPIEVVVIPCSNDLSPQGIAEYFDDASTTDRDSDDDNIDPDEQDIDLIIENNEGVPYAYPHFYQDGIGGNSPHPQPINNEMCNLITGYTDVLLDACQPGCVGNSKFLRTWTILDWCTSEFVHYDQIIKAVDYLGPEIEIPEITASVDPWDCKANVHLPHPEHIFDNCDNFYGYTIGSTGGYDVIGDVYSGYIVKHVPVGTHTIEYKSEDCCGNIGRSYVTLNVVDQTPPVAVSKEFIVVSLTNIGNPINGYQGTAKVFARDLDNGSYDGCTDVTIKIRRDPLCRNADASWGDFVTFCCEDLEGVSAREVDVELLITDENGNSNQVWTKVLVEDKSEDFPVTPPHMILTCDMDLSNFDITGGIPEYFGACGQGVVACDTASVIENTEPRELRLSDNVVINGIPMEAPAYNPSCGAGALRRSFRDCGGGVQWFIILPVDPFDNTSIIWPEDVVVDCDDYNNGDPSWPETTCNLVGVSVERDTFMFDDNSCMKILNHWSVINWCLYDPTDPNTLGRYEHVQVVKIIDNIDPVINAPDSLCFAAADNCEGKDVLLPATAFDNGECGSTWIRWELSIDAYANWTEDYFYTTDTSPDLSNGDPNPFYIPPSTNEEEILVAIPDGIPASGVWHRAIWRAYDGCGNTSSEMVYFQIADKKAPTPYCLNLSTAVMENGEVELWAIDLDRGSFDNCSNPESLIFTFTDVAPPPRNDSEYDSNDDLVWYDGTYWYFNSEDVDDDTGFGEYEDRDDYGGEIHRWEPGLRSSGKVFTIDDADDDGFVEVPVYVWDEEGNVDFCLVTVRIIDNGGGGMAMVSGNVVTESGKAVENIITELDGPLNYHLSDLTDANGEYSFANTPFFADYKVSGHREDDYMNGVSTLDLVMIQRHILGQQDLDSPYKMIAADINNDKKVSVSDLLELRKLILGIYNELPDVASWELVDAKEILDINNPWDYSDNITIEQLSQDMMDEDFIGVKIGDVNNSVVANANDTPSVGIRKSAGLKLEFVDRLIEAGRETEVLLKTNGAEVSGFQLALSVKDAELNSVESEGYNASHFNVGGSSVRLSLSSRHNITQGQTIALSVYAEREMMLSEMLQIENKLLQSEAYDLDNNIIPVVLEAKEQIEDYTLYQNKPNPFRDNTEIRFNLANAGDVNFVFTDVNGRILKVINSEYSAGENSITIAKEDLISSGIVFYTMTCKEYTETRQMIIIK